MKKLLNQWYYSGTEIYDDFGKKRNCYIDNLKFILIILVVIGHFSLKMDFVKKISYFYYFIYVFHMPCFIFVNGYLAKRMNAGGKLRADKILSVFWMYLIFKFGNVLLHYAFHQKVTISLFKDTSAPWYLLALCIWYLSVPLLERIKTKYLISGSFLIGLLVGYISIINDTFTLSRVFVYFPFFILGFCLSEKRLEVFLGKRLRLPAVVILAATLGFFLLYGQHIVNVHNIIYGTSPYTKSLGDLAPYGMLIRGIWYLLASILSAAVILLVPRSKLFFTRFGDRTMQIYMTHIWCRNALVFAGFFTMIKAESKYLTVLVILGSVVLTFLLANRYLKKLYDMLMAVGSFKKILKKD